MNDRDQAQFAQWVRDYRGYLYRAAWALTGERAAAQDLVQETLAIAWRARRQLRDGNAVRAWLYRILRREAMRIWREREAAGGWDDAECENVQDSSPDPAARLDLVDALQRLSPLHREILVLFYLVDMSYADLAQALDIPEGTVMSRLNRARDALRLLLGEEYTK